MKQYVVFVNYGLEGWKIWEQSDSFEEAIKAREAALSNGNFDVVIFKRAQWITNELS